MYPLFPITTLFRSGFALDGHGKGSRLKPLLQEQCRKTRLPPLRVAQALDEAHRAVAIAAGAVESVRFGALRAAAQLQPRGAGGAGAALGVTQQLSSDRKSTRLNSSH